MRIPDALMICAVVEVDEFKNDATMARTSKISGRYVVGLKRGSGEPAGVTQEERASL
jgi:hypothetical protein